MESRISHLYASSPSPLRMFPQKANRNVSACPFPFANGVVGSSRQDKLHALEVSSVESILSSIQIRRRATSYKVLRLSFRFACTVAMPPPWHRIRLLSNVEFPRIS